MTTLTPAQLAYLEDEKRLARLATADQNQTPHVVPVGMWHYNKELGTVDVGGHDLATTKKYRNVKINPQAALVVDDLATVEPWHPRAVIVEGTSEALSPTDSNNALIRITPERVISWGLET